MNWLAHIYLADNTEEDILGNFLGDFLMNVQWRTEFNTAVQNGIKTHLEVDRFSTLHPVFNQSCLRISAPNSMYRTVLIDMFYDHFLARNWSAYSQYSLTDYVARFHAILRKYRSMLPVRLLQILPLLIDENWLVSYREFEGIRQALKRLSLRISHDTKLHHGIFELNDNYEGLENDFHVIMNELKEHTVSFRNHIYSDNCTDTSPAQCNKRDKG